MSANALDKIGQHTPAPEPGRVGQATAVEQSRAVAEVQAAIVVAQQVPRDIQMGLAQMRDSCRQQALAERAFFRYARAGNTITGPSVQLARELARCWGNIQYGVAELRRDDEHHQSEMQAFAWDVQTNARAATTFIVPHKRDLTDGTKTLTAMRDIYENNANNGARRVREMIFAVLPPWFVEEAKDICNATLADGGGTPLPQRIAGAIDGFAAMGIKKDRIERRLGYPSGQWTEHDVAQLSVIYKSIQRGEVTRDQEFPEERVTGEEITGGTKPGPAPVQMSAEQRKKMFACLGDLGITDRAKQLDYMERVIGRRPEHRDQLHSDEAQRVIDALIADASEPWPTSEEQQGGES